MKSVAIPDGRVWSLSDESLTLLTGYSGSTLTLVSVTAGGALKVQQSEVPTLSKVTPAFLEQFVAATGTPEQLVAASTKASSVIIEAKKARDTNNLGNVWIGWSAANDAQKFMLAPGDFIAFAAPPGGYLELNEIYVDVATVDDGIMATYIPIPV